MQSRRDAPSITHQRFRVTVAKLGKVSNQSAAILLAAEDLSTLRCLGTRLLPALGSTPVGYRLQYVWSGPEPVLSLTVPQELVHGLIDLLVGPE